MSTSMPPPTDDWPARAADTIERVVTTVRDRTTRPILIAGRGLVYGIIAAVLGVAALVLLAITLIRILTIATGEVWIADMIVGGVFSLAGTLLLIRRKPAVEAELS